MKRDVRTFTQLCIHGKISRNGGRIPRPLLTALHGGRPDKVVLADFLYMGPAKRSKLKYVLVIREDCNSYSWLRP